jgi:isoquinoline 1-oxidoreductase subunit alpha
LAGVKSRAKRLSASDHSRHRKRDQLKEEMRQSTGTAYNRCGRTQSPGPGNPIEELRMPSLTINGHPQQVDVDPDTPLLWVLRDTLGLTGTRYGCGIAQCGACTVHIDGVATRSCSVPVRVADGAQITTIEGLSTNGALHPVQKAWIAHDVPQCGYCQSGMIMAVVALLKEKPRPTDADIDAAITNICRCGTYARIRAAIHTAAAA